jgi:uncharacterized protein (DUF885 family)
VRAPGTARWLAAAALAVASATLPGVADAARPAARPAGDGARLKTFLEDAYATRMAAQPMLATELGEPVGLDRWDDLSDAAAGAAAARARAAISAAGQAFAPARLSFDENLARRVFVDQQRLLLERYRWRTHLYPLNQIVGLQVAVPGTLASQPLATREQAEAFLRRVARVDVLFAQLDRTLVDQAAHGVFMPKSVYPLLVEGARAVIAGAPFEPGPDSPILADFRRRIADVGVAPAERARLVERLSAVLRAHVAPAYRQLIARLEAQERMTPVDGGVWQLPDGDEFYRFLIRQFTTTTMTPAEVHDLGLREVARIHAEMDGVMRSVGFDGSLRDFMARMKADPRSYLENSDAGRQAYLERARTVVDEMRARIGEAFTTVPPPLEVRRTPAYREGSAPTGFYEAGSADGRRPGVIYLNVSDMRQMPVYELEDLLYHEGIPGHHLQISTIQRDPSIPRLSKVNEWWQDTAFVEGWGLYAENLARDMGFYRDPYAEFGRLSGELWRATRLVVDSGLHWKRWTRSEAIRYLDENTASPHAANEAAVDRYLAVPGQATAFTVGMLKFVAERERARAALGAKFDLREFHRVVLSHGYVPLWAVEQTVDHWIEQRSGTVSQPARALAAVADGFWKTRLAAEPSLGIAQGDQDARARFDDSLDEGWRRDVLRRYEAERDALEAIDPAGLAEGDRTTWLALRHELAERLGWYGSGAFETARRLPLDPFQGPTVTYVADAAGAGAAPYKTVDDYEQALRRADAFARWSDQAVARLREGLAKGQVLPRRSVERLLEELAPHFGRRAEDTDFWRPVAAMPDAFPAPDRARLEAAFRVKIVEVLEPAFARLHGFLADEYLPHARATVGLVSMPGGAELYRALVRQHTTTDLTPADIHALGRREVDRLLAEVGAIRRRVGFQGTDAAFLEHVRTDPALHFGSPDEVIPAFTAARDRVLPRLPALFHALPRSPFEIRALPESARENPGNGWYAAPAADGSRPGILWVNVHAAGVTDRCNVTTIALHEGLPGHHLAMSLALEQENLPAFRRHGDHAAFEEGWALYAESLGRELGMFDDPWQYLGHLNYALLRANRLVVDTGLHADGWSFERAVSWMLAHSSMTRAAAEAEVERYVEYPAQALSYKVGELRIRGLRAQAEAALGPRFDVRAFHDRVLLAGSLPLDVLERRVDEWIAAQTGAAAPGSTP